MLLRLQQHADRADELEPHLPRNPPRLLVVQDEDRITHLDRERDRMCFALV